MSGYVYSPGIRVRYIPNHARLDRDHQDCEDGTVSSVKGSTIFVRFDKQVKKLGWDGTTAQGCPWENLIQLSPFPVNPQTYLSDQQLEQQVVRELMPKPNRIFDLE